MSVRRFSADAMALWIPLFSLACGATMILPGQGHAQSLDECLVGVWQEIRGGADEKVSEFIAPGTEVVSNLNSGVLMALQDDGTYVTAPYAEAMIFLREPRDEFGLGTFGPVLGSSDVRGRASGRWSAEVGRLTFMVDEVTRTGETTVRLRDGTVITVPMPVPTAAEIHMNYTCADETLETRHTIEAFGTIETFYRRMDEGS
jgi:hypothetical protein